MARDFKASQVRTTQIIASGSTTGKPSLLIASASSPGVNFDGAGISNSTLLDGVGKDVFVFVSGTKGSKGSSTDQGVTLFGGDVVISGTAYNSSGSPYAAVAGADTQVQFNDGGLLGADSGFTFNKATDTLSVGSFYVTGSEASNWVSGSLNVSGTVRLGDGPNKSIQITGSISHGNNAQATGAYSYSHGTNVTSSGYASHAEGYNTLSSGNYSHAEGSGTTASLEYAHAEGVNATASGTASHAEGSATTASGDYSHAEGSATTASGNYSHAEGSATTASGNLSHAEGQYTEAAAQSSHAEGQSTLAQGTGSHAEGLSTTTTGNYSHAEGISTTASGLYSHAEGTHTLSSGLTSHAEGYYATGSGNYSHAEGQNSTAAGNYSHAEGRSTLSSGLASHTEGYYTTGSGNYSHAEGRETVASNSYAHAEGSGTTAEGDSSHAEGTATIASGFAAHAAGSSTHAIGDYSYSGGFRTIASGTNQTVVGKHNKRNNTTSLFVVGNGTGDSNSDRNDIFLVDDETVRIGSGSNLGSDVFLFVSGSKFSNGTAIRGVALFDGDVVVSGNLSGSTASVGDIYSDNLYVSGSVTIAKNLTVNGTTTTVNTENLTVKDSVIYFGSGSVTSNNNGGIALASGSSVANKSLVWGRVAADTWGAGILDVKSGTESDLTGMTLAPVRASSFEVGGNINTIITSSNGTDIQIWGYHPSTGKIEMFSGGGGHLNFVSSPYQFSTIANKIALGGFGETIVHPNMPGIDSSFFVSGSVGSRNTSDRGTAVFGGDVVISGTIYDGGGNPTGIPAGSDTQVQFNDGGSAFGADSGLTYDKTVGALTSTNLNVINKVTLGSSVDANKAVVSGSSGNLLIRRSDIADFTSTYTVHVSGANYAAMALDGPGYASIQFPLNGSVFSPRIALAGGDLTQESTRGLQLDSYLGDHFITSNIASTRFVKMTSGTSGPVAVFELTGSTEADYLTIGHDTNFFVSGSKGSKDSVIRGTAVFGGDVTISGTLHGGSPLKVGTSMLVTGAIYLQEQFSTPNTQMTESVIYSSDDGLGNVALYWKNGDNVPQKIGSGGTVAVTGTFNEVFVAANQTSLVTTSSVSFAGAKGFNYGANSAGSDVFLFVSGAAGSKDTFIRGTAVLGGDTVISGSAYTKNVYVTGVLYLQEQFSAPNTGITESVLYTFDDGSGTSSLFWKNGDNVPQKVGTGGSATTGTFNEVFLVAGKTTLVTTSAVSFAGNNGMNYGVASVSPDAFFFVSGAVGSKGSATRGTSIFGGDTVVSGSLYLEKSIVPTVVTPTTTSAGVAPNTTGFITSDLSLGNVFRIVLTNNTGSFNAPTNVKDGQQATWIIKQDATGFRLGSWATTAGGFAWPGGIAPTLSTGSSAVDLVTAQYDGVLGKWLATFAKGFS